jgi:hypothetical protein
MGGHGGGRQHGAGPFRNGTPLLIGLSPEALMAAPVVKRMNPITTVRRRFIWHSSLRKSSLIVQLNVNSRGRWEGTGQEDSMAPARSEMELLC